MKEKKNNPVKDIFAFVGQEKKKMTLSTVLSVMSAGFGIVPYLAVGKILIWLFEKEGTLHDVILAAVAAAVALVCEKLFSMFSTWLSHQSAYGIMKNIRIALTEKIERTSLGWVQGITSGAYKETVIDMVDRLEDALAHMIPEMIPNIILPVAVIIWLFILDWRIALASLISIVVGVLAWGLMMGKRAMEIWNLTQKGTRKMNENIVEYVNGMEVIKAYNQTASSMKNYGAVVNDYRDALKSWYRHCHPYLSVYSVVMPATTCFVLPIGGMLLLNQSITLSVFLTCLVLSLGIVGPLEKLVLFSNHLNEIAMADTRIQEILQAPELSFSEKEAHVKDAGIVFQNVSFGYGEKEILHDVSFEVKPHTMTAIVGASGGGKSTIARLIARFWDVNSGSVNIGGVNVREIPQEQLMDLLSFVEQDNFLTNASIKENIRMGKPDATDDEIRKAAQAAGCEEFIQRLPMGYDTNVGDAGGMLSGGERQRIAIVRAMLKDAPIIVLDEATASIDNENEKLISKAIAKLTKGKTIVTIAHRLSTIQNADQILVVKNGEVIEKGTHKELLAVSQEYSKMWQDHIGADGWSIRREKDSPETIKAHLTS
ncbi:MAG: ABC transporter ATP-binding protein [Roseburia sp.]